MTGSRGMYRTKGVGESKTRGERVEHGAQGKKRERRRERKWEGERERERGRKREGER